MDGKLIEGLVDDREIGAERIFSKQMEERGYKTLHAQLHVETVVSISEQHAVAK